MPLSGPKLRTSKHYFGYLRGMFPRVFPTPAHAWPCGNWLKWGKWLLSIGDTVPEMRPWVWEVPGGRIKQLSIMPPFVFPQCVRVFTESSKMAAASITRKLFPPFFRFWDSSGRFPRPIPFGRSCSSSAKKYSSLTTRSCKLRPPPPPSTPRSASTFIRKLFRSSLPARPTPTPTLCDRGRKKVTCFFSPPFEYLE